MSKIGVFVCHCGENIGATVDCARVAETSGKLDGVAYSVDYKYMCSDPGQSLIKSAIKEKGLTGVVVAACSPRMHEPTFRKACAEAGLNPYMCEMANLREHVSWVHEKGEATTEKAIDLVRILVEKVKYNQSLNAIKVPVTKRALVIGGGIAGISASNPQHCLHWMDSRCVQRLHTDYHTKEAFWGGVQTALTISQKQHELQPLAGHRHARS